MKSKIFIFILGILILFFPESSVQGVKSGLLVCSNVIIPSLFPFTFCIVFLNNTKKSDFLNFLSPITKRIFKLNIKEFFVLLLSFVGGYPIGAKMISELYKRKEISYENAQLLINYTVNAGPAFIVIAVGCGVFGSQKIGYLLFASHIIASIILALIFSRFKKAENNGQFDKTECLTFGENFVYSVSEASKTVLSICSFVVIFSFINSLILKISEYIGFIKHLLLFNEISCAMQNTSNIYVISFLLGFADFCIWFQVFHTMGKIRVKYPIFILSRFFHGLISSFITFLLVGILKPEISTISNNVGFGGGISSTYSVLFSLIAMSILLIITLYSKSNGGKIYDNLL